MALVSDEHVVPTGCAACAAGRGTDARVCECSSASSDESAACWLCTARAGRLAGACSSKNPMLSGLNASRACVTGEVGGRGRCARALFGGVRGGDLGARARSSSSVRGSELGRGEMGPGEPPPRGYASGESGSGVRGCGCSSSIVATFWAVGMAGVLECGGVMADSTTCGMWSQMGCPAVVAKRDWVLWCSVNGLGFSLWWTGRVCMACGPAGCGSDAWNWAVGVAC